MWLVAMFDLRVKSTRNRRNYARFRNRLLEKGFDQLQLSVYARFCESEARARQLERQLEARLPTEGRVRFLMVTDRQFAKMRSYAGIKRVENESQPKQILLF